MRDDSQRDMQASASRGSAAVRRPARGLSRLAALFVFAALTWAGGFTPAATAAQTDYSKFDHLSTGFALDGQHLNMRCEQCHLNGIFKGTSPKCQTCHVQGNQYAAVYISPRHIPIGNPQIGTSNNCETCHTTNSFRGVHFSHAEVVPHACGSCHNDVYAIGKASFKGHPVTNAPCDSCHATVTFKGAEVFPVGHIPTAEPCSVCHSGGYAVATTRMVHSGISGGCTVCHAADATGVNPKDFVMQVVRDASQVNVTTTVDLKLVSQNYHPPTSSSPTHFPIAVSCDSCHATPTAPMLPDAMAGGFAGGKMSHNGISSGCAGCHADGSGPFIGVTGLVLASTKGPHIPISGTACENCHKSTTVPGGFAGTAMVHNGLNGLATCTSCHENNATNLGYFGLTAKLVVRPPTSGAQPNAVTPVDANHPASGECSQCHSSTTNFNTGIALPSNHIPVGTTTCTNCHTGSSAPYAPPNTVMNHTGFTSSCNNCHGAGKGPFYGTAQTEAGGQPMQPPGLGGIAATPPHIPLGSADCSGCHSTSSTSQGGFHIAATPSLSAAGHGVVSALNCTSCHYSSTVPGDVAWYGTTAKGAPGAVGTTGSANHIAFGTGDCKTCHGSNFAAGAFHIAAAPALSAAGHAAVSALTCDSCHADANKTWFGTVAVSPNIAAPIHIPTSTAVCSNCHASNFATGGFKITTSPVLSVAGHASVSGLTCVSCHENNAGDLNFQGVLAQIYLRPGNAIAGKSPVDAGHATGLPGSADCVQCHSTAPPFSAPKPPSNHVPLPSSGAGATCSTCHSGGYTPATSKMVHSAVTSEKCAVCHTYNTTTFAGTGPGTGGQPWPVGGSSGGAPSASQHIPFNSADCTSCHTASDTESAAAPSLFKLAASPALSAAGHATVSALTCASCHYQSGNTSGSVTWEGTAAVSTPGAVGTLGAANHIALGTGDCKTCHGSTFSAGAFHITTAPNLAAAGHAAVSSVACATCHGAGAAWFGEPSLVTALATHMPMSTATCSACHGSNFVVGGFHIATTPSLSVANHSAVSALTCVSCHENNATDLNFQGVGTNIYVRPGTVAVGKSPIDNTHATGTLGTNDCSQCHTTTPPFNGNTLPTNHIPLPASPNCATCHSGGYSPGTSKMVHSAVTSEKCGVCHTYNTTTFAGTGPGTGGQPWAVGGSSGGAPSASQHIPFGSADCTSCHASSDSESAAAPSLFKLAAVPALSAAGHATVSSLTCVSCHYQSGNTSGSVTWEGTAAVSTPGTVGTSGAGNHIAMGSGDCKTCHGSTFSAGAFHITTAPNLAAAGHAAVTSVACATCHGTGAAWFGEPSLQTALATHIPYLVSATCDNCHGKSFVTNGFKIATSPLLTQANHAYVSATNCNSCHENNPADLAFQGIGANIFVRPGAVAAGRSPVDVAHAAGNLAAPNDCVNCHNTTPPFVGGTLPSNHIPLPTPAPTCATCHAAGYGPTLSKIIHAAVTAETCTACHGKGKGPFSGTSQGTGGQPYQPPGTVGTSGAGNHIPVGAADCKGCHAANDTETAGGTNFKTNTTPALNAAGHTAVISATVVCATCHSSGMAWYGVTIKTPPGTVGTSGAANHIPLGIGTTPEACNVCHAATNYTSFAGTAMNHASITTSCNKCHNAGMAWYGVTIKTDTLSPPHIPVAATPVCEACHSAANFTKFGPGTAMNPATHLQVPTTLETCLTCHENGKATAYYGVTIVTRPTAAQDSNHPPAPQDCGNSGCHTTTPPFTGGVKPSNHIPSSATCGNCHTGYTPATTTMNHADSGVGTAGSPVACATCHNYGAGPYYGTAQGKAGGQPLQPGGTLNGGPSSAQHLPFIGAKCNICHTSTTVPGGFATGAVPHTSGTFMTYTTGKSGSSTPQCKGCHGPSGATWQGLSWNSSTATVGSHQGSTTSQDCINCHSATGSFNNAAAAARSRPGLGLARAAGPTNGVTVRGPNGLSKAAGTGSGAAGGVYTHAGVTPGACATCHQAGGGATPRPASHLQSALSCDACHRTTTWVPATFAHAGVAPHSCSSCHAPGWATPKPAGHFVTVRTCDTCHNGTVTWTPVRYDHLSPRYRPQPGSVRCIDCHTTNTEMVVPGIARPSSVNKTPGSTGKRN